MNKVGAFTKKIEEIEKKIEHAIDGIDFIADTIVKIASRIGITIESDNEDDKEDESTKKEA